MGALTLTEGVLKTMFVTQVKLAATAVLAVSLAATGAGVWASQKPGSNAQPSSRVDEEPQLYAGTIPAVVARVNGMPVTREQLAARLLTKYGPKELETVIATVLLEKACKRHDIIVTDAEIDTETAQQAQKLGVPVSQLYRTLAEQRGMSKYAYLRDIVAVNLKLKKLQLESDAIEGFDGLKRAIEKLDGPTNVEILWGQTAKLREVQQTKRRRELRRIASAT